MGRRRTCPPACLFRHDLAGVHSIRSRADVGRTIEELATARRVCVVGGGYIGLEAAAILDGSPSAQPDAALPPDHSRTVSASTVRRIMAERLAARARALIASCFNRPQSTPIIRPPALRRVPAARTLSTSCCDPTIAARSAIVPDTPKAKRFRRQKLKIGALSDLNAPGHRFGPDGGCDVDGGRPQRVGRNLVTGGGTPSWRSVERPERFPHVVVRVGAAAPEVRLSTSAYPAPP